MSRRSKRQRLARRLARPWENLTKGTINGRPKEEAECLDARGLECMRCEGEFRAEEFVCLYADYWVCGRCAREHQGFVAWAKLMNERGRT